MSTWRESLIPLSYGLVFSSFLLVSQFLEKRNSQKTKSYNTLVLKNAKLFVVFLCCFSCLSEFDYYTEENGTTEFAHYLI